MNDQPSMITNLQVYEMTLYLTVRAIEECRMEWTVLCFKALDETPHVSERIRNSLKVKQHSFTQSTVMSFHNPLHNALL